MSLSSDPSELPAEPRNDEPTVPETPVAKAAELDADQQVLRRSQFVRALIVDGLLTAGICWAAYSGYASWEVAIGFVSTAILAQARPAGSVVETVAKVIARALPVRRGAP